MAASAAGTRDGREARGKAAIVGVTDAVSPTGELAMRGKGMEAAMVRDALADAGLSLSDVDAVFCAAGSGFAPSMELAEYLAIQPRWTDNTSVGGSSFEVHVEHAAAAIALGLCEVAVIAYAANPRSSMKAGGHGFRSAQVTTGISPIAEWEIAYGTRMPIGAYALAAGRHMAEYGTTSEQLAQIAVSAREWAQMNPRAYHYGKPITVQDVLDSPVEATPLHKLDCCLVTDGAGAVVMTSAERARDLAKAPAYVLGAGTSHTHMIISQMPDLTVTAGAVSGPKAFGMAGIRPADVDVLQAYDSFTITLLLHLEDLGFCPKGEAGKFVEGGALGPGGQLPTNTNGGGLAYTHPGMYGMFLLVEAVRQLRGECEDRQVPGAEIAVAHGCGGVLSSTSTVVLGTEATL